MPTSNYWPSAPTAVVAQLTEFSNLLPHSSPSCARGGTLVLLLALPLPPVSRLTRIYSSTLFFLIFSPLLTPWSSGYSDPGPLLGAFPTNVRTRCRGVWGRSVAGTSSPVWGSGSGHRVQSRAHEAVRPARARAGGAVSGHITCSVRVR